MGAQDDEKDIAGIDACYRFNKLQEPYCSLRLSCQIMFCLTVCLSFFSLV